MRSAFSQYDHFYILNDKVDLAGDMAGRTYFMAHSERDWKFFLNLYQVFHILRRERPNVILSTGAGPAVPAAIVGRLLFGTRVIFIETITRINKPSLTGMIMYRIAHRFFYQWHTLERYFPQGEYGGTLL